MRKRPIVACLLLVSPYLAQTAGKNEFLIASSPTVNCKNLKPADKEALKTKKKFINLSEATTFVVDAISQATCENYDPVGRFQLTTADLDFQTLVDNDGTLEVLFIGGVAGELDKQVTSDSDFTYSVPPQSRQRKLSTRKCCSIANPRQSSPLRRPSAKPSRRR
jgi:hypothetical protein